MNVYNTRFDDLCEEISSCHGKDDCWGVKNLIYKKPVVLPCKEKPDYMIITEQMNPRNMLDDRSSSEVLLDYIIRVKSGKEKTGILPIINELFSGEFLRDFDTENKIFKRFYWTHFIKCPGNIRKRRFNLKGINYNICADTFLLKEIRVLQPKLIVCMGKLASEWILNKVGYRKEWTELIWEEIEKIVKNDKEVEEREITECNHKAKIIVLPHPSSINPLASFLNKKLKNLLDSL